MTRECVILNGVKNPYRLPQARVSCFSAGLSLFTCIDLSGFSVYICKSDSGGFDNLFSFQPIDFCWFIPKQLAKDLPRMFS